MVTGMVEIQMGKNDKLCKEIQEQILVTGSLVKQKMKAIQLELLEELEQNGKDNQGHSTL